jgi:hypothetical protein
VTESGAVIGQFPVRGKIISEAVMTLCHVYTKTNLYPYQDCVRLVGHQNSNLGGAWRGAVFNEKEVTAVGNLESLVRGSNWFCW